MLILTVCETLQLENSALDNPKKCYNTSLLADTHLPVHRSSRSTVTWQCWPRASSVGLLDLRMRRQNRGMRATIDYDGRLYKSYGAIRCSHSFISYSELLNVTVVRLLDRAKFCWVCAKSWDVYTQTRKSMHFYHFYIIFALFHLFVTFGVFLVHFDAHIFQKEIFDWQENELLEGLQSGRGGGAFFWHWVSSVDFLCSVLQSNTYWGW